MDNQDNNNTTKKDTGQHYTFENVFKRYLSYQELRIRESSFLDIKKTFELHILPVFSNFCISDVRTLNIINWQTEMNLKNLSYKYKTKILSYLKTFFNYCANIEELLTQSPVKSQLKFVETSHKEEMLIYSPDEYLKFRKAIKKEKDLVIFDLLYFTGMRKGELLGLKWADIRKNTISITKAYTRKTKDGKWKLSLPKSKNSIREILIPKSLMQELDSLRVNKKAKSDDFVLGGKSPANEKYLDSARDRYVRLSGVKRIRIHDFRHSHVSYLISCNVDILTIAKRIGDKVDTVLSTYAHIMPNKQVEMLNKLEKIIK